MYTKRVQQFSIIFAIVLILWAILPFLNLGGMTFTDTTIATSTILILVGIAYPIVVFKPQWNKAMLFIEGLVFIAIGIIFLKQLANPILIILGVLLVIIAILAYLQKLPKGLLKFFYKTPK